MGAAPGGCSPCPGRCCSASRPSESTPWFFTPWRDVPERLACGWRSGPPAGGWSCKLFLRTCAPARVVAAGQRREGARQPHKRLQYCINVNRTSPDHLLLGRNADIDKSVECSEYSAGLGKSQNKCSLTGVSNTRGLLVEVWTPRANPKTPFCRNTVPL